MITNLTGYKWTGNDILINFPEDTKQFDVNNLAVTSGTTKTSYGRIYISNSALACGNTSGSVPQTVYTVDGGWKSDESKTITFIGGTDATNSELIAWLSINGTFTPIEYLCIEAIENTNIGFSVVGAVSSTPSISYSKDRATWTSYTLGSIVGLSAGEKCYWKGTNSSFSNSATNYIHITSSGKIKASGRIITLATGDEDNGDTPANYFFCGLFRDCTNLVEIDENLLKTNSYRDYCFYYLFANTGLTEIPENLWVNTASTLGATTNVAGLFGHMFRDCTGITKTPKFPEYLAYGTYYYTFSGCTNLETIVEPISTIKSLYNNQSIGYAYGYTFQNCAKLWKIPEFVLDGTITMPTGTPVAYYMFDGCPNIKISETKTGEYTVEYPFPATVIGSPSASAYSTWFSNMFKGSGGTFTGTPSKKTYYIEEYVEISAKIEPENKGTVSGTGYYKVGTNCTLTAIPSDEFYKFDKWILPYTRLDYIESSGTQYIITNYKPNYNTKIEIDFQMNNYNDHPVLVGCQTPISSSQSMLSIEAFKSGNFYLYASRAYVGTSNYGDNFDLGDSTTSLSRTIIQQYNTGAVCTNRTLGYQHISDWPTSYAATEYMTILGGCYGTASFKGSNAKLYGLKIFENNVLIHNFIPAIRHSDSAIGLLDLVELKFYGNSGSGVFQGGGIVE